jgi:hypothetical protein
VWTFVLLSTAASSWIPPSRVLLHPLRNLSHAVLDFGSTSEHFEFNCFMQIPLLTPITIPILLVAREGLRRLLNQQHRNFLPQKYDFPPINGFSYFVDISQRKDREGEAENE